MASTSAPPSDASSAGKRRMTTAAATLCSDYQSLIIEIRKALSVIKGVAVDLEKEQQSSGMVKQLEDAVVELLYKSGECAHYSRAVQAVADRYEPYSGDQATDFEKVLTKEFNRVHAESPVIPESDPLYRQFKEAIWNVHHAGQPMPGEEHEDIVMTSTQSNLLNMTCPLTGKPLTALDGPVRCIDCKHIYEEVAIMHYIQSKKPYAQCPVAGCPKILNASRIQCDPLLPIEIAEIQSRGGGQACQAQIVEDCTELEDD